MTRVLLSLLLLLALSVPVDAHLGSPDLFYSGNIGPYPARVTIRMPRVIPGRAEISVRLETHHPVEVSFLPLYARTSVKNAPPPDRGLPVDGDPNLYAGELWLMSFGSYSVEVQVRGPSGNGSIQIPVTSVATKQLPMPSALGKILAALGGVLVIGLIAITSAATREATLGPDEQPGLRQRRKAWLAASITALILAGSLHRGWLWWKSEERDFREHLREGAWPDLAAEVNSTAGGSRVLKLRLGTDPANPNKRPQYLPPLIPDHGKLMHLFIIRQESGDAFAHLHPVRKGTAEFEVNLPPLPAGRYSIFCDLTFEGGMSSTATVAVELPQLPAPAASVSVPAVDLDDSWATFRSDAVPTASDPAPLFRLENGATVRWQAEKPVRTGRDASLRFELADPTGKPLRLEPYMGMLSHAAVLRHDGAVFAHLHPTGNYSMAAQSFFAAKFEQENSADAASSDTTSRHSSHARRRKHASPASSTGQASPPAESPDAVEVSLLELPYQFPEPGDYRIWLQFKHDGRVQTAAFDAHVEP